MSVFLAFLFSSVVTINGQELATGQDLFDQYNVIFPNGNRNAASHRWATYIIERSTSLEDDTIQSLFSHFCPVSGSPIGALRDEGRRWAVSLPSVSGNDVPGVTYLCCWPCICDVQDWVFVDTKTITTAGGERQYNFLVIGNPCTQPSAIPVSAPDVNCDGGELLSATMSDNGYVIIGMFFDDEGDAAVSQHADMAQEVCEERAAAGYNSGMGQIFIEVAGISPVVVGSQLSASNPSMALLVSNPSPDPVISQQRVAVAEGAVADEDVVSADPEPGQEPEDVSHARPSRMNFALFHCAVLSTLVLRFSL